jgi:hypothetical protein
VYALENDTTSDGLDTPNSCQAENKQSFQKDYQGIYISEKNE